MNMETALFLKLTLRLAVFVASFCFVLGVLFKRTNLYKCCAGLPTLSLTSLLHVVKEVDFLRMDHENVFQLLNKMAKKFQKEGIFVVWLFRPLIFVYNPDYTKILLNHPDALDRSVDYLAFNPWAMSGIVNSNGEKWYTRRRLLNHAFYSGLLPDYGIMINEHSRILIKKLKSLAKEPWFEILPVINLCAMDIIAELVLGIKMNSQEASPEGMKYMEAFEIAVKNISYRLERPWTLSERIFNITPTGRKQMNHAKYFRDYNQKAIDERSKAMRLEKYRTLDPCAEDANDLKVPRKASVLNTLLENHIKDSTFTLEHVAEETNSFMLAGNNATPQILSWAIFLLGLHPDVQKKVFEELDSIFGGDQERPVTSEDTTKMKYLECVIKETLRMYPGAPLISRKSNENIQIGKYTIPPGPTIIFFFYMMHMDPNNFPNPEKFDPDRFSPENSAKRHPCCYLPFSFGPRNCLAQKFAIMEMKIILSHVLRNFTITSVDSAEQVAKTWLLSVRNAKPIRVALTPRYHTQDRDKTSDEPN